MNSSDLLVRCMAWQEGGLWVAVCIDYSLAAQSDSLGEAKAKLHEQIAVYVREAMTVDREHASDLLTRRASLRDRLLYSFWKAVHSRPRVRRKIGALIRSLGVHLRESKQAYTDPLPLSPVA